MDVPVGTYQIIVEDEKECADTLDFEVSSVPSFTATLTDLESLCFDETGNLAAVIQEEGIGPYSYVWESGEMDSLITVPTSGDYVVTVTDAEGCDTIFANDYPPIRSNPN